MSSTYCLSEARFSETSPSAVLRRRQRVLLVVPDGSQVPASSLDPGYLVLQEVQVVDEGR
jgi:hypothetical protein